MNLKGLLGKFKGLFSPATVLPNTPAQQKLDQLQYVMEQLPQVECPIENKFTPGLYSRKCFVPKGAVIISKIHKTEHQFVVTEGDISVWIEGQGVVRIKAPYYGITKPGTRRILYAHADTIWTTFHPSELTDLDQLEAQLIEPRDVSLQLTGEIKLWLGLQLE